MSGTRELHKGGYERYQQWLHDAVTARLLPTMKDQEAGEALLNIAFDLQGRRVVSRPPTEDERYLGLLFYGFNEIFQSVSALDDLMVYLRRFPFSQTSVTRSRYLQFVIESYFHENYILQERLVSHTTQIERAWRADAKYLTVKTACGGLRELVEEVGKDLRSTRGSPVHQQRFADSGLIALSTLELFRREDTGSWERHYMDRFRAVRKEWLSAMRTNRSELERLLDPYFHVLGMINFSDSGTPLYPSTIGTGPVRTRGKR